jgi:hypothetical protein
MVDSKFKVQCSRFKALGSKFTVQDIGFEVQGSTMKVQGSGMKVQGSGFKVQGSRLGENINRMKIRCIQYIAFIISDLPGKSGRQIEKIDLMAVSTVERAAEGEIYNVTLF